MKLTVGSTTGLKLPEGHTKNGKPITDFVYWDSEVPGFGLRLRAGGKRAFIFQYKTGGTQYRMTLGKYPAIAAPQAREAAAKLHARVMLGENPALEKKQAKAKSGET